MMVRYYSGHWAKPKVVLVIAAAMLVGACTTTTITPEVVNAPSREYRKVVIGDVSAADKLWETRLPYLRRALVAKLQEEKQIIEVLDPGPETAPEDAIVVSGEITEVDKGDRALRFIIGFGAGRAKAAGLFSIHDGQGTMLARFESRKAYSGGAGIGGLDIVDMDELMEELGTETALSIMRWIMGEPLEPPKKN